MKVLFVCSGNICRSPMAAETLRQRAAGWGLSHVVVDSAGTLGIEGHPASPEAVEAMGEVQIDLSAHRSRGLTELHLRTADLVIVMEHDHIVYLLEAYPPTPRPPLPLRAFENGAEPANDAPDLDDPIGRPLTFYRKQRDLLLTCIDHLALHLRYRDEG